MWQRKTVSIASDLSAVEPGVCRENLVNTMPTDAFIPCAKHNINTHGIALTEFVGSCLPPGSI